MTYKGKVIKANILEHLYGKKENKLCDLCGREEEDTFHIMYVCPHYQSVRSQYKKTNDHAFDRNNYVLQFNNVTKETMQRFMHFFYAVFYMRSVYLEYMNDVSMLS